MTEHGGRRRLAGRANGNAAWCGGGCIEASRSGVAQLRRRWIDDYGGGEDDGDFRRGGGGWLVGWRWLLGDKRAVFCVAWVRCVGSSHGPSAARAPCWLNLGASQAIWRVRWNELPKTQAPVVRIPPTSGSIKVGRNPDPRGCRPGSVRRRDGMSAEGRRKAETSVACV